MFNNISYNVVIERFKVFADGHFLIKRFSHGQVDQTDLDKDQLFPWMHVAPVEVRAATGARVYTFDVIFADIPRDKEDKTDYQKESISDCIRLAEDLLSEIQNGRTVFGDIVEVEGESTLTPFIEEWTHTLSGCTLALTISVPNDYNACDIPADWAIGGGGSGTPPSPLPSLVLQVNNVDNVVQNVLDLVDGDNVTIEDLGDGRVRINSTGGGGGTSTLISTEFNQNHVSATGNPYVVNDMVWYGGNLYRCIAGNDAILPTNTSYWTLVGSAFRARQTPVDWNATSGDYQILNRPTLATVATTGDYNDLDNLPSIPAAQVNSDWNSTSGLSEILNKPTIPAAQVNSDWNSVSGVSEILNKPTIPAAQVNSDWNAVSGLAEILNKPTIPSTLDSLTNVNVPAPSNAQVLTYDTASSQWIATTPSAGSGTVTSVGLTMPSAFSVTGSPITTAGTLAITGAGLATQYVRGDGQLANFPTTSGGGSSVSYYLNGSINQGTIGGSTYYQMSKTAVFGAGTDFTRTNAQGNGLIAQFITDVNDPNVLLVPGGNFNLELYFSASSSGGTPSFYVELYKYDGSTFTLLATDVATPEGITQGTVIDAYFTALAVPATTMALTDRLALRVFVTTSGRTLKLHTEYSHLSQVITTLSTGINAINGLTSQVQNLATGTAGSDFAISSTGSTHTFNLPTASAANRGALSSADWSTFNGKQNSIGLTTVGNNLATLANPSAISYVRINADNSVTTIDAATLSNELYAQTLNFYSPSTNTTTTSATAVDITGMSSLTPFPVNGKWYVIKLVLGTGCNNTGGLKIAFTWTGGSMSNFGGALIAWLNGNTGQFMQKTTFTSGVLIPSGTALNTANNATGSLVIEAKIFVTTAPTSFSVQVASAIAGQTSTIYSDGSFLQVQRVN
jgi:hypothetical protein